mgnify:CR=1 FL=1
MEFDELNKSSFKAQKLSPDSMMQLAFQVNRYVCIAAVLCEWKISATFTYVVVVDSIIYAIFTWVISWKNIAQGFCNRVTSQKCIKVTFITFLLQRLRIKPSTAIQLRLMSRAVRLRSNMAVQRRFDPPRQRRTTPTICWARAHRNKIFWLRCPNARHFTASWQRMPPWVCGSP